MCGGVCSALSLSSRSSPVQVQVQPLPLASPLPMDPQSALLSLGLERKTAEQAASNPKLCQVLEAVLLEAGLDALGKADDKAKEAVAVSKTVGKFVYAVTCKVRWKRRERVEWLGMKWNGSDRIGSDQIRSNRMRLDNALLSPVWSPSSPLAPCATAR